MRKILLSLLFVFVTTVQAQPFKNIFLNGAVGDYSIYQNGSSVTILNIHSKELPFITVEEITLPKEIYENVKGIDLNNWLKKNAPNSTSWTLMEIDTSNFSITSTYCLTRKAHLHVHKEDTLIASLLGLEINPIPITHLPRTGPRPATKNDDRPIWVPSMFVNGKKQTPKTVDVYCGRWGKDSSPLSDKNIDLYILDHFPFPYWIQIHGDYGSKKMISLDSGSNLLSPVEQIPQMPPKFISSLEKWNNDTEKFSFLVQGERTISNYTVYLLEVSKVKPKLIPIEATFQVIDTNVLKFDLLRSRLTDELTAGKKYRLYLSYDDKNGIKSITSKDIIHWK